MLFGEFKLKIWLKVRVLFYFVPQELNEDQKSERVFDDRSDFFHQPFRLTYHNVAIFSSKTEN